MFQAWRQLLFLHWVVEPDSLAKTLPEGVHLDLFEGEAFLGIVPFLMCDVRPRGLPAVPGLSNFLELNVRIYVHDDDGNPGVWFYSLDANSRVACATARTLFKLPYHYAKMRAKVGSTVDYEALRSNCGEAARYQYAARGESRIAEPGSLEFFLLERYLLFSFHEKKRRLFRGHVHHEPYRFSEAEVPVWSAAPLAWNGMTIPEGGPRHACMAENVDVRVFGLQRCGSAGSC